MFLLQAKRLNHIKKAIKELLCSRILSLLGAVPISDEHTQFIKQAKLEQQQLSHNNILQNCDKKEFLDHLLKQAKIGQSYWNCDSNNSRADNIYVLTVRIDDVRLNPFQCRAASKKEYNKIKGYWQRNDYEKLLERVTVSLQEAETILQKYDKQYPSMKQNIVVCVVGSEYSLYNEDGTCIPVGVFFQKVLPTLHRELKKYDDRITFFPGTIPVGAKTSGSSDINVHMNIAIQGQCGNNAELSWKAKQVAALDGREMFSKTQMISSLNELSKLGVKVNHGGYVQKNHFLATTSYGKEICFFPSICIEHVYGISVTNASAFLKQNPRNLHIPAVEILMSSSISDSTYQYTNLRLHVDSGFSTAETVKILAHTQQFSPHRTLCKTIKSKHMQIKCTPLTRGKSLEIISFTPVKISPISIILLEYVKFAILTELRKQYPDDPKKGYDV